MKTNLYSIVITITLFIALLFQFNRIEKLNHTNYQLVHDLQHYKIANSVNIARKNRTKEKELVAKYVNPCIPVNLVFAVRVHENGSKSHEFGAKKFFNYHEHAQYETANKIVEQEVYKFIDKNKQEFVIHLAKRWNEPDMKNWSKSVLKIWEVEDDRER